MEFYTHEKVSPVGSVNKADLKKWGGNLVLFLAPLGVIYLLQLYSLLQNGPLAVADLYPSALTMGAIELYVINGLLDLLKKFTDPKK